MQFLEYPIMYLEDSDFDSEGNIQNKKLKYGKVVILIQTNRCSNCTIWKPDYLKAAMEMKSKGEDIIFTTMQLDSDRDEEKNLKYIVKKIKPDLEGVPSYLVFINGVLRNDKGPSARDYESIINYIIS